MKRFAVMDGVIMEYEFHGDWLEANHGLVLVYQNNTVKIILKLADGQSIMHVTDVVGPERTINAIGST